MTSERSDDQPDVGGVNRSEAVSETEVSAARHLFLEQSVGVMSTHSVEVEGYPFGSVVPYCQDENGQALILISRLAQHTKNIANNNKVSLLVMDDTQQNKQRAGRLTLLGDSVKCVADCDHIDELASRYYQHYPETNGYHTQLDFDFYRIKINKICYIVGLWTN